MDNIKAGYWAIATQKHLKSFVKDAPNYDEFDNIDIAGKAGRFLGAIRGNSTIENLRKIEKIGNTVGIAPKELHRIILPELVTASDGRVELIKNTIGEITGVAEYVFTNNEVLQVAGDVFENQQPRTTERLTIQTLDETKKVPLLHSELYNLFSKQGFSEKDVQFALALQRQFKLIQSLDKINKSDPIISNEYIWGSNHDKIAYALAKVSFDDKQSLSEIIAEIQSCQGIPSEELRSQNIDLINMAKKIGMINPVNIISNRGIEKEFAFCGNSSTSSINDEDIMDDVKVLLASIRFGERYTEYSTINDPVRFLNSLINSSSVGPHSANLTDYILLEKKGIVQVVQETKTKTSYYNGGTYTKTGPCLKLIKKDVAQRALDLLKNPSYSVSEDIQQEAERLVEASEYRNPEESRVHMAELPETIKGASEMLTMILRDEIM